MINSERAQADKQYLTLAIKDVYCVLMGDTPLGNGNAITELKMPYLSGPMLVDISNHFGFPAQYGQGFPSRWVFMDELFRKCIKAGRAQEFLNYILGSPYFAKHLTDNKATSIQGARKEIIDAAVDFINVSLECSGHELRSINGSYTLCDSSSHISLSTPAIKRIDLAYITDMHARAIQDVENGILDEALTKARTLLEETFIQAIERAGESPNAKGNIQKLYAQVKGLYNMRQGSEVDASINDLLNGLNKVVDAVSNMRNIASDAHGHGSKRFEIRDYHARLVVNSATAVSEFMLSVQNARHPK